MLTIIMEGLIISAIDNIYIDQEYGDGFTVRVRTIGQSYNDENVIYESESLFAAQTFHKRIADQVAAGVKVIDLREGISQNESHD